MPASEKVWNFVPFDLSRWKKNPSSKQESNELALFMTFYVEVDIWIICKERELFFPLSSLPASFVPLPHFVVS